MKILMIVLGLFFVLYLSATIINIPADQSTIQAGIDIAIDADTVLVHPGNYIENINYLGKNITVASLYLTTQDTSYISQTIIDGNQNDSVVIFESGEDSTAFLTGFIITNGRGNGGGISCENSSPSLENVTITGNSAYFASGGGISCGNNSNPILKNVTIIGNSATMEYATGGGIVCYNNSSPILENVIIADNSGDSGGGISCIQSSPILKNVIIIDNFATGNAAFETVGFGGGIKCYNNSNPILKNVTITGNYATFGGGIGCTYNSSPILENVTITGNIATDHGGGILCDSGSSPIIVNSIVSNNIGYGIYNYSGNPTMTYSNFYNNEDGNFYNVSPGIGCIVADPLFVDILNEDYHLTENSPCIDAGNPDSIFNDPEDPNAPGYALYPAMGTITNDMGTFGGPNASEWIPVSVEDDIIFSLSSVSLHQNYPNPFNPETNIVFNLQENGNVQLDIYNIKGQKIKKLVHDEFISGSHSIIWNGDNETGKSVSSGVYMYKLKVNGKIEAVKKCLLLK